MRRPRPKQYIGITIFGCLAGVILGLILAEVGRLALLVWAILLLPSLFYFVIYVWKARIFPLRALMVIGLLVAVAGAIAAWGGWISGDDPNEQWLCRWLGVGIGLMGGLYCSSGMLRRWYQSRIRAGDSLDNLIEALSDADPVVRCRAAAALQTARMPEAAWAVPALLLAVEDDEEVVRGQAGDALRALDVMYDDGALPSAAPVAPRWPLKRRVVWSCILATLVLAAYGCSYTFFGRISAACLVRDLGGAWAVPRLLRQTCDKEPLIQRTGSDGLRRLGQRAVPALVKALGDADEEVRITAADTLGELGPTAKDAVEALQRAAVAWSGEGPRKPHQQMHDALHAVQALARIDPRSAERFLPALIRWLHSGDCDDQRGAVACLHLMGPHARPAIPDLREELKNINRRFLELSLKKNFPVFPPFGTFQDDRDQLLIKEIVAALSAIAPES